MNLRAGSALTTALLVVAGCGTANTPVGRLDPLDAPSTPYDGPMSATADPGNERRPVMERGGAAALALECDWVPQQAGAGDYVDGGLESVQDSATRALANYFAEESPLQLPTEGYRVERDDGDRVLFSYDVDRRTRVAFIAADGITDWTHDTGWGIESWAACDPSELPAEVTESLGIGVWTDRSGERIPTAKVRSFRGSEHCDWQAITFLVLGPRRDGRQLWLGPDHEAAYLVSVDDPTDMERWPAAMEPIHCM